VVTPARVPDSTSAWAIYSILLHDAATRQRVQDTLRAEGVPTAIYYPRPLHLQPAYRDHHNGACLAVSEDLAGRILALPIHPYLSETQIAQVCDRVLAAVS
jgi:UDP-2-acetamido-2-deoxy-ribo-hexuluronate aminotransferase